jgi:putative IMPACT (imprinted ancient) family translation regulator
VQELLESGQSKYVRKKAYHFCLAVRAKNWSVYAERFLQRCEDDGNIDAHYILGMV